nr:uncharacterized protein LOC113709811 [Coffea arabica]
MSMRKKKLNNRAPPNYEQGSSLITLRCHCGGLIFYTPQSHYQGGDVCVLDYVESIGLSIFEVDRLIEAAGVFGHKVYYVHQLGYDPYEVNENEGPSNGKDIIANHGHEWGGNDNNEADSSSESFFSAVDSDYNQSEEDDADFNDNKDKNVEWLSVEHYKELQTNSAKQGQVEANLVQPEDDDVASDSESDFENMHGPDDENDSNRCVVFNPKHMDNPKLKLKMFFSTIKECKLAIINYSVRQGRLCKFVKQDLVRLRSKCRSEGYNWQIYARKLGGEGSVQIRTFEDIHKCGFTYENPLVNFGWVGRKYCEKFKSNPKVDVEHFRKIVMKDNKCSFTKKQTYRARKKALDIIHDSESDQYRKLGAYMHEIQKSNPGSSIILKTVDGTSNGQQIKVPKTLLVFSWSETRLFRNSRGVLLIAVGLDANNSIFLVAYAAVEGENKEFWTWFFNLLKEDLKIERDYEWTIMSDKQKRLIQACGHVFPNAAHRFCVKHLHNNFSTSGFKGEAQRRALWAAANATTPAEFIRKMEDMAAIDLDVAKWFDDKPPSQWSRAHFSTYSKCDVLLNNICECFNSRILDAREKPIIEMMKLLRLYMMQRMQ